MNGVVSIGDAARLAIRALICRTSWDNVMKERQPRVLRALIATAEHPEEVPSLLEEIGIMRARVYWIDPILAGVGSEMYSSFVTRDGAQVQITVLGRIYR